MTRRELVLKKLHGLPEDEVAEALRQLTHHVQARLRFGSQADRTKSGAHGPKNIGMDAIDYYVGEAVRKLYEPEGWDWKFEERTLAEQLMRIANKLISDKVADYKDKKDGLPVFADKDVGDINVLKRRVEEESERNDEQLDKLIQLAHQLSKDDDNLQYYTLRYFEKADAETIAIEMNITPKQVYALRKKLVRRLMGYENELSV